MDKLTKEQKRKRKLRKKDEYIKRRKLLIARKEQELKPWEAVKMKMFRIPDIVPKDLSKEQRLNILREIGQNAQKEFDVKYIAIQDWFSKYDALYILSFCAVYFVSTTKGIDPEVHGSLDFYPHFLEIMQAFALAQERCYSAKPLHNDAIRLKDEIKRIGELMPLRFLNIPDNLKSDIEISGYHLRTEMMGNTTAVRNWAYHYQMKRVACDLAELVKDRFESIHNGINPVLFIELLFKLNETCNDYLNEHGRKVRTFIKENNYNSMMQSYNKAFPENTPIDETTAEELWEKAGRKIHNLRTMLIYHSDLKLANIFTYDLDSISALYGDTTKKDALKYIFDKLSIKFGDLKEENKEHIILDNPVHKRPFIKVGNNEYFSVILGVLPHFSIDLLEELIAEENELRIDYSTNIKSKYLENEIERMFRKHFPNAKIFRGSKWVDPADGKTYENDLIVIIDSFAVIVEAKSGSVTAPAKRGAPKRLFHTLQELIEIPSEQAHRFIAYLKSERKLHLLNNSKGERIVIDSSKISYFIPIGITLANLGMVSSNLKKIIEAGITTKKISELAPSISLTDLEIVFELLPLEAMKLHYFERRREFEDHVKYEGDELDLLAFYLDNGFNFGDIEYKNEIALNLSLKSKELDPYFVGTNEGVVVRKPELSMSKWWKDLLFILSEKRPKNWIETSFCLLNSTKEDQDYFASKLEELKRKVKCGKVEKKHNWVVFSSGPEQRRYLFYGYPYITKDKEERKDIIVHMIKSDEAKDVRGIVVIGQDVNQAHYPYSILAGRLKNNLFDI